MLPNRLTNYYRKYKFALLSLILFLLLSMICFIAFNTAIQDKKQAKLKQLEIAGNLTYQDFKNIVGHNIVSLEHLRDRIVESDGDFKTYLQSDTERIIKQSQAIKFIEYIDSNGIITFVAPLDSNRKIINLDIKKIEYRYPSWRINSKDTLTNITSWVSLTQHGKAFLIDVPVYYNNKFQGTISAGMDFKNQFDNISSKQNVFSVLIKDDLGNIFYSYNNPKPEVFNKDQIFKHDLNPLLNREGGAWKFEFMFYSNEELKANTLQNAMLVLGLFLSFLIGLLAYFTMLAKKQANQYRLMNQRLNTLNAELEKEKIKADDASRSKTEFLSNMSHEIRTPLSAILSISEIIEGKKLSRNEKEFLRLMQNSSRTLMNLVNNILHIDKIESGNIELSKEVFSPFISLKKIVEIYGQTAAIKGVEVITNFDNSQNHHKALGDISRIEQIFTNLISNAIKFTDEGEIVVFYEEKKYNKELKINLKVSDTGMGIDSSKLDLIFERFKQLDYGITKRYQGSGLGLAITKTLVEQMGGRIKVDSKEGVGSTFAISLNFPIVENQKDIKKSRLYQDLSHLSVLIVDDNLLNQKILVKILSKTNIKIHLAKDGNEALLKCASHSYDLIFMDVHMPGKDGYEVVKYLRSMHNTAVILGFSADVTKESIERGMKAGMNDYLTKPISQETLFAILKRFFS